MTMKEAIDRFVHDGDTIVIEGFTHLICFAAGHEIIRQRRRELTLCRLTPDLIYDQLIGAGCVRRLVFSWAGNPGAGPLHALRRAVEQGVPNSIELEEYSHFGMVARLAAGAAKLPFYPLRDYRGSDLPRVNPLDQNGDLSVHWRRTGCRACLESRHSDRSRATRRREWKCTRLGLDGSAEGSCLRGAEHDRGR